MSCAQGGCGCLVALLLVIIGMAVAPQLTVVLLILFFLVKVSGAA